MRLLQVITELYEGGAENALAEVSVGLARAGHEVHVACLFGGEGAVGDRLRQAGVPVTELGVRGPWAAWRGRALRRLAAQCAPDVVHAWLFHASLLARFMVPRRIPVVCGLRVAEPRPLHVWLEQATRRRVAHYACVAPAVAEFARRRLGVAADRVSVIGNGVYLPDSVDAVEGGGELRGLTVGRVTRQKGTDILLQALARLPRDLRWSWRFVGDEPEPRYSREVRALAARLGLGDRLQWSGAVPRAHVAACLREGTLFVLPSRWEGQPNVVLEACAYGLPVVATRVDGTADLEAEVPGALEVVPPADPEALAAAILRLHADVDLRRVRREHGLALARGRAWPRVQAQYLDLYQAVVQGGPGRR